MDAASFTRETTLIPLKYGGNTSNKANKIPIKCVCIQRRRFFKGSLGAHAEPSDVSAANVGVASESGREKATDGQESPHLTGKLLSAAAPMERLVAPLRKRRRQDKPQTCDRRGKTSQGSDAGAFTEDPSSGLVSRPPSSQGLRTRLRSGTP